jgi:hypothetical protein
MTEEIDMSAVPKTCEYDTGTFCRVPDHVTGDTNECMACGTVRTAMEIKAFNREYHMQSVEARRYRK